MSVRAQVLRAIDANPGLPHNVLARKVAADLGEVALLQLATERIERLIASERRKKTRDVEDENSDEAERTGDPRKWAAVEALLEEFREQVIVDWTDELLTSDFALGDGTRVTWGEATLDQHLARIRLFTGNVRAGLNGIRRHEAAIAAITDAGVETLNEAVRR